MSPERRITKRQIKQDKLVSTAFQVSEYVQKNKKYFIAGVSAVAAIILIAFLIDYSIEKKNLEAEDFLGKAQFAGIMGQSALAINDYKIIIEQYGSTKSADKACFSLGRIYYDQQNYDSSLYYFNMYINDFGKADFLLTAAYGGAAKCLEEKVDYSKAGEYYMNAAKTADNELFSPDYYMMAGRVYLKAGLIEQAEQAYQQVADNYERSSQNTKAKKKLAEIKYRSDETN